MIDVRDEVADLEDQADFLFDEVAEISDEQNLQDERIFIVEQETSGILLYFCNSPNFQL